MKTVTKADIIESVAKAGGFERSKAARAVEGLLETIKATLATGENLLVSGFGKFEVKSKKPRRGRNPVTGEPIILPARKVLLFVCSAKLRERINSRSA